MVNLKALSYKLRLDVLDMIYNAKQGHLGGDFSVMDILVVLYFNHMNVTPKTMNEPDRDLFVMSKGHSVEAYYAVLSEKGFFDKEELKSTFSKFGSKYIGHPNNKVKGIEMNSGSLGHGLPVCVGMALAKKMDNLEGRVYTVMGDGELAEGSVWEGFMAGGHFKLDNLTAIIDKNGLQISGSTDQVMSHGNLQNRIESFGWNVIQVDGNDVAALDGALQAAKLCRGKPTAIIANTIKGFGGGLLTENKISWHHKVPTLEEYQQIKAELQSRLEAVQSE